MNQKNCGDTKDRLPEYLAGDLSVTEAEMVRSHLGGCEDCRMEAELIGYLRATTPQPRAGLATAIGEVLRLDVNRRSGRGWWMAAAATVVLALGVGVFWEGSEDAPVVMALAEQVGSDFWPGDETLLAGGLVWDDLSEDELTALLEDWDDEA